MCMPGLAEKIQELVDDAVAKGATVSRCPLLIIPSPFMLLSAEPALCI